MGFERQILRVQSTFLICMKKSLLSAGKFDLLMSVCTRKYLIWRFCEKIKNNEWQKYFSRLICIFNVACEGGWKQHETVGKKKQIFNFNAEVLTIDKWNEWEIH